MIFLTGIWFWKFSFQMWRTQLLYYKIVNLWELITCTLIAESKDCYEVSSPSKRMPSNIICSPGLMWNKLSLNWHEKCTKKVEGWTLN